MNNREINFRMWNPVANKMVYNPKRIALDIGEEIDINKIFSDSTPPLNSEKVEWMQFTGLLDKNGKEIYEGDITERGEIVFYGGQFRGQYFGAEFWEDSLDLINDLEIIGNIHENKELIT